MLLWSRLLCYDCAEAVALLVNYCVMKHVMWCVLVCDLFNAFVCLVCGLLCDVAWCVCLCVCGVRVWLLFLCGCSLCVFVCACLDVLVCLVCFCVIVCVVSVLSVYVCVYAFKSVFKAVA